MVGPYIKIRLYMHVFVFNLLLIRDDLFFVIPIFKSFMRQMFATEPIAISIHENSYKTGRIRGDKFSRERCFVGTESYQCITKIKQKVILFTAKEKHTNRHPPPRKKPPK